MAYRREQKVVSVEYFTGQSGYLRDAIDSELNPLFSEGWEIAHPVPTPAVVAYRTTIPDFEGKIREMDVRHTTIIFLLERNVLFPSPE